MLAKNLSLSNIIVCIASFLFAFFTYTNYAHSEVIDINDNKEINKNANIKKPYVVKKGDTLWDIAYHFFNNPSKWVSIWEKNSQIENPHLIYPGNKIWLNEDMSITISNNNGEYTLMPKVRKVENYKFDSDGVTINTERKIDFINSKSLDKGAYIVGSVDDSRIFFAKDDLIYIKSQTMLNRGDKLSILRIEDSVKSVLHKGEKLGNLIVKFGKVVVTSEFDEIPENNIFKAMVEDTNEEISAGNILILDNEDSKKITLSKEENKLKGVVAYINDKATEAAEMQLVIIETENSDNKIENGKILPIYKHDRIIKDPITKEKITINGEKIGEVAVIKQDANTLTSIIINSKEPVMKGYMVR